MTVPEFIDDVMRHKALQEYLMSFQPTPGADLHQYRAAKKEFREVMARLRKAYGTDSPPVDVKSIVEQTRTRHLSGQPLPSDPGGGPKVNTVAVPENSIVHLHPRKLSEAEKKAALDNLSQIGVPLPIIK